MKSYSKNKLSTFIKAVRVTYGTSIPHSIAWLMLLLLRALSFPITVWLTGFIINMALNVQSADVGNQVWLAFLWLLSLTIGTAITPWWSYLHHVIADSALLALQVDLIKNLNDVPDMVMFENKDFHDDISFAQRSLEYTPGNFMSQCSAILENVVSSAALIYIIVSVSWIVAIIMLVALIPHAIMMSYLARYNYWNARLSTQQWKELQYCRRSIGDNSFAKETRLFGQGRLFSSKTNRYFTELNELLQKARFKSTLYPMPTLLMLQIGSVISLIIILQEFHAGIITAAGIVMILQSLYGIQGRLEQGLDGFNHIIRYILIFMSIFRVLSVQPQIHLSRNPRSISIHDEIEIRFDNVCFSYPDGPQILHNLNFTWKPGENLALVGENGCGKTTIVKLLLRFFDPNSGTIYVNNQRLSDYDVEKWRSIISPVFQDFGRYEYTVRENICFGVEGFSDEDLMDVLNKCGLREVIERLPEGLNTRLGRQFGATDLSGGQWQRLAIARALCNPSSIMVLDEPTAALDPLVESDIYELFSSLSNCKSTLMITHRLGSVKMADLILVLSNGAIVESGSHAELFRSGGLYSRMFQAQTSWYEH